MLVVSCSGMEGVDAGTYRRDGRTGNVPPELRYVEPRVWEAFTLPNGPSLECVLPDVVIWMLG